jgi:hypothetical protein
MVSWNASIFKIPAHRLHLTQPPEDFRRRALVRLYERRCAVDHLIRALERYQQEEKQPLAESAELTAEAMSS